MVTYIATLLAKPGHELEVSKFYQDLEPLMRGFDPRAVQRGGEMLKLVLNLFCRQMHRGIRSRTNLQIGIPLQIGIYLMQTNMSTRMLLRMTFQSRLRGLGLALGWAKPSQSRTHSHSAHGETNRP